VNLLNFIDTFHTEVAKSFDVVESSGEANGLMEWVNGRVKNYEVYFLWFPKSRRLVYVVKGPGVYKEEAVEVRSALDAIAFAERLLQQLKR
jgi:hypothetical protein